MNDVGTFVPRTKQREALEINCAAPSAVGKFRPFRSSYLEISIVPPANEGYTNESLDRQICTQLVRPEEEGRIAVGHEIAGRTEQSAAGFPGQALA